MSNRWPFLALVISSSLAVAEPAQPLSARAAVDLAAEHNPTLSAALVDVKRADAAVEAQSGRYPFTIRLEGGPTLTQSPSLNGQGNLNVNEGRSFDLRAALGKTWAYGTNLSLSLQGSSSTRLLPILPTSPERLTLGPGYGAVARLSLTQPTMRGFGLDVGESSLRQARLERDATQAARERQGSELARDVLVAYGEAWYAAQSVEIERAAREVAEQARVEASERIAAGSLAEVELLSFESRVASLTESVATARLEETRRGIELARLLGKDGKPITATGAPVVQAGAATTVLSSALATSPTLAELESRVRIAREQQTVAADALKPKLDVEAYVQSEGLGNKEVGPALSQLATGAYVSGHVGLVYEAPLSGRQREAELESARRSEEAATLRVEAARQQISAEVATLDARRTSATERLTLATKTETIAAKQVDAERARFEIGATTTLAVREAEEQLRQSRLRVARARVDLAQAEIQLLHLAGGLLAWVGQGD